jgi:hypothetical protein
MGLRCLLEPVLNRGPNKIHCMKQLTRDQMRQITGGSIISDCCGCEPSGNWGSPQQCGLTEHGYVGVLFGGGSVISCTALCAEQTS